MKRIIPILVAASLLLSACSLPFSIQFVQASNATEGEEALVNPPQPTPTEVEQEARTPPRNPRIWPRPHTHTGPTERKWRRDLNPLTGLPVDDPDCLKNPPAVISITNFPASARPQAGLDFSNVVVEAYIGEGMTRFLAIFYCDYPEHPEDIANQPGASDPNSGFRRSDRSHPLWQDLVRGYSQAIQWLHRHGLRLERCFFAVEPIL